jgi:hypothetical protein
MSQRFEEEGIAFEYPDDWGLEREENEEGWTVTVQSPETAFVVLRYDRDMPPREDMVQTALEALQEDYPELDAVPQVESLGGQPAVGHDIEFLSLDLTNTCWTRSLYTDAGTLLVLCQLTDLEAERHGPALRGICKSLEVAEE